MAKVDLNLDNYPSNSRKSKEKAEKERTVKPIIQGSIKKKNVLEKAAETIIQGDRRSVTNNLIFEVLIPTFRDMIADGLQQSISMIFYGDPRSRGASHGRSSTGERNYVSYNQYYSSSKKESKSSNSLRYSVEDIVCSDRGEAEKILSQLQEDIAEYGSVSVLHLYQYANLDTRSTDAKYGWTTLDTAWVDRDFHGDYILKLPKAKVLD